jgi:hypothetical protein
LARVSFFEIRFSSQEQVVQHFLGLPELLLLITLESFFADPVEDFPVAARTLQSRQLFLPADLQRFQLGP